MITYYDIIQRFFSAAQAHLMIRDVGYGPISDIKTRAQNAEIFPDADEAEDIAYPYMFLNPAQHSRSNASVTYTFNIIMMDMAWQEIPHEEGFVNQSVQRYTNEAQIQSQCQQYIDDIIGYLYFQDSGREPSLPGRSWDISMDVTYTPFVERFQDSVAGMTAQVKITVPQAINNCIAPMVG